MNFKLEEALGLPPYSLERKEKHALFQRALNDLTRQHYERCWQYRRILDLIGYNPIEEMEPEALPMIPVRLFKEHELKSVPDEEVAKVMTSSGTSQQKVSKIFLDKANIANQTKTLVSIISSYIGKKRLPLVILDSRQTLKDRAMYSARGAGIVGFSSFGRDVFYALNENMEFDIGGFAHYVEEHGGEAILFFGYTYMIWQYVIQPLRQSNVTFDVKDGRLFHIGGWKKLKDQEVDAVTYNKAIRERLGDICVHNYYGMAEQLGSVFVECEHGHMHCSNFSDVIIRDAMDFSVMGKGQRGIIELQSLLPTSYPGHILLTEDEGEILGEDDCPCGRKGKYFRVLGRLKAAEIRGCSDTYAADYSA